jgi:transposase
LPICPFQQVFQNTYLFGVFSPLNGDSFLLQKSHCCSSTFQAFLDNFSKHHENEFKILVLDNGAFHKAQSLKIPENIGLLFLPPYSPALNPAASIWAFMKTNFLRL